MFCSNCGAKSEGGQFCSHCGARNEGIATNKTNVNKKVLGISVAIIALIVIIALISGTSTPEKTARGFLNDFYVERSVSKIMKNFDPTVVDTILEESGMTRSEFEQKLLAEKIPPRCEEIDFKITGSHITGNTAVVYVRLITGISYSVELPLVKRGSKWYIDIGLFWR